jgi:hypothetical protein
MGSMIAKKHVSASFTDRNANPPKYFVGIFFACAVHKIRQV